MKYPVFRRSIVVLLTLAMIILATPEAARADMRSGIDGRDGDVNTRTSDDAHRTDTARVENYRGPVRRSTRETTPEPSGMPVVTVPCQRQTPGRNGQTVAAAYRPIRSRSTFSVEPATVIREPAAPPVVDTLDLDPANPPLAYFAVCEYAQAGTAVAQDAADVDAWLRDYFSHTRLPTPRPRISAENGGICGVVHTVDLQMPTELINRETTTPFGSFTLHIYGRVLVDWGDGQRNVYTTSGGPYPNSDIRHTWTDRGTYDITARSDWIANYSIGPYNGVTYTGVLAGLSTNGTIPNFRVWEAQAMLMK